MEIKTKEKKKPLYLEEIEAKELGRLIEEDKLADIEDEKLGNQIKGAILGGVTEPELDEILGGEWSES